MRTEPGAEQVSLYIRGAGGRGGGISGSYATQRLVREPKESDRAVPTQANGGDSWPASRFALPVSGLYRLRRRYVGYAAQAAGHTLDQQASRDGNESWNLSGGTNALLPG